MADITTLERELTELDARKEQILAELSTVASQRFSLNRRIQTAFANNDLRTAEVLQQERQSLIDRQNVLYSQNDLVQSQISSVNQQIAQARARYQQEQQTRARATQGLGTISSAAVVGDAQRARDNRANTQLPEPGPLSVDDERTVTATTTVPTSAEEFFTNDDFGTDASTRSLTETQSVPPPTARTPYSRANDVIAQDTPTETQSAGAGAPPDDSADPPSESSGPVNIARKTEITIRPQANILNRCANYTYSISIYLMSPEDYNRLLVTKQKYIPGYLLLIQSAGIPVDSGTVDRDAESQAIIDSGGVSLSQGRNQYFPLDYYIDDLELNQVCPGKGAGGAHNVTSLKFRIVEPNGITLLDNLWKAANQYVTRAGGATSKITDQNYAAQNYLMVVRFYGYDQNGELVTNIGQAGQTSDSNAIVEKFIPFQFTNIKFKIANRLTEYECEAVCPQNVVNTGQARGTIPYNIELTATTLQKLFNGNQAFGTNTSTTATGTAQNQGREAQGNTGGQTSPDTANTAPNPTLVEGLAQALNRFQAELVTNGTFDVADQYRIIISHPELANSSVVPPGGTDRKNTPSVQPQTAAQTVDGDRQSVTNNAKTVSAMAGTSIVQFLDLAVRSSDYIFKQQKKIIDKDGKEVPQGTPAESMAWYRIGIEAKQLQYDPKRNDYAYEIIYEIAPYGINSMKSDYFPEGKFRGAQKEYFYWFTGQNTSVLNFEQDFNFLFFLTVNTRQQKIGRSSNVYEIEKRMFSPNSPQSSQGTGDDQVLEPSANAADYLYSPSDQGKVKITIVGDPAWIYQGELWSGVRGADKVTTQNDTGGTTTTDPYFDAFLSDGTINFDAREALFRLAYNKPQDYDTNTGLINLAPSASARPVQDYIYKATSIKSYFRQGRFTQDLEGVLLTFPLQNTQTGTQPTAQQAEIDKNYSNEGRNSQQDEQTQPSDFVTSNNFNDVDQNQDYYGSPAITTDTIQNLLAGTPTVVPQAAAQPATSAGEVIGDIGGGRTEFGAFGAAVGVPYVDVVLKSGTIQRVFLQSEITALFNQGSIDNTELIRASRELNLRQQVANSPVRPGSRQSGARDD